MPPPPRTVTGGRPTGQVTRGTTAPNRLRRVDRWLTGTQAVLLRGAVDPLVVDLGFGASAVTTVELATRLRSVRADVEVVGIEIDPARVGAALPFSAPGLSFRTGGFELALDGRSPVVVRAFNVLRQYDEAQVGPYWGVMAARLAPGGLIVDGTCDEVGRRAAWVVVDAAGPRQLTLATHLAGLTDPSELAERLPKALIHRNVPGEPVHALLTDLRAAWLRAAPLGAYGVRQRWVGAVTALRAQGWPVLDGPGRWRLGELSVAWSAVAPGTVSPVAGNR